MPGGKRFEVTRDRGHLVVQDNRHRCPALAILPGPGGETAQLNMAKTCCDALNRVWDEHQKKWAMKEAAEG